MKRIIRSAVRTEYEWLPQGSVAPLGAWYAELDYNGGPTGIWASVGAGDRLPVLGPEGHTWRIAKRAE